MNSLVPILLFSIFFCDDIHSLVFNQYKKVVRLRSFNEDHALDILDKKCDDCVSVSKAKFTNGSEYYSNPKSQMGSWIDEKLRDEVVNLLTLTEFKISSKVFNKLDSIYNQSYSIDIFHKSNEYSLTLFHLPPGQRIQKYSHEPGTFICYKSLYGVGYLETYFTPTSIRHDVLESNKILSRIGGPTREICNNFTGSCGILELAIYPPMVKLEDTFQQEVKTSCFLDGSTPVYNILSQPYVTLEEENMPPPQVMYLSDKEKKLLFYRQFANMTSSSSSSADRNTQNTYNTPGSSGRGRIMTLASKPTSYDSVVSELAFNIGGLGDQLQDISRRLLYSRRLPPKTVQALGISHVSGLLLHGPPGTGKTLLARQLSALLSPREPKIINGPEILDKFIGEAEKNIRDIFYEADNEWDKLGSRSALHVIVFDEFDSIAKKRGLLAGDGSGVRDSVVNQLLTKMDGIKQRNNVLIIALTNRKDLIDPALLRPGRLEVQLYIPPPDRQGRKDILYILCRSFIEQGLMENEEAEEWFDYISSITHGWTGADLAGLTRSASSYLTQRYFDTIYERTVNQQRTDDENESIEYDEEDGDDDVSSVNFDHLEENEDIQDQETQAILSHMKFQWNDFQLALKESTVTKSLSKRIKLSNFIRKKWYQLQQQQQRQRRQRIRSSRK